MSRKELTPPVHGTTNNYRRFGIAVTKGSSPLSRQPETGNSVDLSSYGVHAETLGVGACAFPHHIEEEKHGK